MTNTPTQDDLNQLRRSVRALELLADSWRAHQDGDRARMDAAFAASADECPVEWNLIQGGMRIGEIPKPGDEAWNEYYAVQREKLSKWEREAGS